MQIHDCRVLISSVISAFTIGNGVQLHLWCLHVFHNANAFRTLCLRCNGRDGCGQRNGLEVNKAENPSVARRKRNALEFIAANACWTDARGCFYKYLLGLVLFSWGCHALRQPAMSSTAGPCAYFPPAKQGANRANRSVQPQLGFFCIGEHTRTGVEGLALWPFQREGAAACAVQHVDGQLRVLPGFVLAGAM